MNCSIWKIDLTSCVEKNYIAIPICFSLLWAMNITADSSKIANCIDSYSPETYKEERTLALFSAVITFDETELTVRTIKRAVALGLERSKLYEIILQSYLFLGFPRMLQAADTLNQVLPLKLLSAEFSQINEKEAENWHLEGINLCKSIYQEKYEPLKDKVMDMAPEVFRWMVHEGYGKVLSRKKLSIITRELSIIAFLMMENRERQLHSHIYGARNVGASSELISCVINDIGDAAGAGFVTAKNIMEKLR